MENIMKISRIKLLAESLTFLWSYVAADILTYIIGLELSKINNLK